MSVFWRLFWFWVAGAVVVRLYRFFAWQRCCTICGIDFGKRAKKFFWRVDSENHLLCSQCNRRMKSKNSAEKFNRWNANRGRQA